MGTVTCTGLGKSGCVKGILATSKRFNNCPSTGFKHLSPNGDKICEKEKVHVDCPLQLK